MSQPNPDAAEPAAAAHAAVGDEFEAQSGIADIPPPLPSASVSPAHQMTALPPAMANALMKALPHPKPWSGTTGEDDVHCFLRGLKRYFTSVAMLQNITIDAWGVMLHVYVRGEAAKVWDLELQVLELHGTAPSWVLFADTMLRHFGTLLPARDARLRFMQLSQSGTVEDFAKEARALTLELSPSSWPVADSELLFRYYGGLQDEVRRYVDVNAPAGWYLTAEALISATLHYAQNLKVRKTSSSRSAPADSGPLLAEAQGKSSKKRGRDAGPSAVTKKAKPAESGEPYISGKEWNGRLKAGVCPDARLRQRPTARRMAAQRIPRLLPGSEDLGAPLRPCK